MTRYFAKTALLPGGWAENILIETDRLGYITDISPAADDTNADSSDIEILGGTLLAGMANLHSHAFQRAMAGLTEYAANPEDSFWSWRTLMYRFANLLEPEDFGAIAAQLYIEMLKAGYTCVGEFHYVHHNLDGVPYDDMALLSRYHIEAALAAGISITHIPVLYAYSNFGGEAPHDGQKRFINDVDGICVILESLRRDYGDHACVSFGVAPHSLRAVNENMLHELLQERRNIDPALPIHMHIAEQVKEVDDCLHYCAKRPVEFLHSLTEINDTWCFIHATHMSEGETRLLAESGAAVSLCTTTEGNLGDGIFPLVEFIKANGSFGIGSDSNSSISIAEELRWLEYGQRLKFRRRNLAVKKDGAGDNDTVHIGRFLYQNAAETGRRSLGQPIGKIETGYRADWVILEDEHPLLAGRKKNFMLDSFVFAGNQSLVKDVYVGGKKVIADGVHQNEQSVRENYVRTIRKILS